MPRKKKTTLSPERTECQEREIAVKGTLSVLATPDQVTQTLERLNRELAVQKIQLILSVAD